MPRPRFGATVDGVGRASLPALVLAAAMPFVFLHVVYQPTATFGAVTVTLSDLAILAAVLAAVSVAARGGLGRQRRAVTVWIPLALFLVWSAASLAWARHFDPAYALGSHVVSVLKYSEYALLAPAVAVILRSEGDRRPFLAVLVVWSSFLSLIGVLQFLGLLHEFEGRRPLQREPSYLGVHELGALSGAVLVLAFVTIVSGTRRRSGVVAGVAGGIGVAVAAALDSVGGIVVAAVAVLGAARLRTRVAARRAIAVGALVVVVGVAAVSLRASAVSAFLQFLGVRPASEQTNTHVQTYAHRTLLVYLGVEIWLDHPLIGAGWQESQEPAAFEAHLAAAHRRFPDEAAEAFPSTKHKWGVQNGAIQTLADLGIVGFALLVASLAATFRLLVRAVRRGDDDESRAAVTGIGWLCVAIAVFTGTGLLPGTPIAALLWISVGLGASLATD